MFHGICIRHIFYLRSIFHLTGIYVLHNIFSLKWSPDGELLVDLSLCSQHHVVNSCAMVDEDDANKVPVVTNQRNYAVKVGLIL